MRASPMREPIVRFHRNGVAAKSIARRLKVSEKLVSTTIARFKELGNFSDRSGRGRPPTVTTPAMIKKVRGRFRHNSGRSVCAMARELKISQSSLCRMVKNNLKLKAYKKSTCQFLSEAAKIKRKDRAMNLLRRFRNGAHRKVLFTDEKIFCIEQPFNTQNDRVYAKTQPNSRVQRTGYPKGIMVFAGITANGKTPLIFVPQGIKVNGNNYLDMLKTELMPWVKKHFKKTKWTFQQDGAPAHKHKNVQAWCESNFPDFIAFNQWPPSSPDLNPMDYSVWSVLEAEACSKPHRNIDSLKDSLKKAWDELDINYLRATVDSFPRRLEACVAANGDIFEL
nr:hypothetical protein F26H9.3 - Caenorhabditis elegans [Caenorhabditis elegans]